ncbi:hypothetical protein K438DRAFT_1952968 [Mycena galopus ATCC 62051]|nr:hypothetical protein K438DRAFT_1952968 [Mycena galopus ATCC 62051]
MFSRLRTQTFIIAALGATKVFAVIMGFPPSGTTLQRGSNLTMTWGGTSILSFAIGLENATDIFPIINNVDAQSFKTTITLPIFAVGDYTLAFLSNDTFDFIEGNTVTIVDDTSLSTTSEESPIPSPISTTRGTTSLPGSPSTTSAQLTTTRRKTSVTIGSILGIVFGAIVTLVILAVLLVLRARRKRRMDSNFDPFVRIQTDKNTGIQQLPPPTMHQTKRSLSDPVPHDGQGYLVMQIHTLQKELEDLRGAVDHGPHRAMEQNGILQERIRMLELGLQGRVEPPPGYLEL